MEPIRGWRMRKGELLILLMLLVVLMVAAGWLGSVFYSVQKGKQSKLEEQIERLERQLAERRVERDTVVQVQIVRKPMVVARQKAQVAFVQDSVVRTQPFVARMDTVAAGDTLSVEYRFPEHLITAELRRRADTLQTVVVRERTVEVRLERRRWWEELATHLGAALVGYVVARATK